MSTSESLLDLVAQGIASFAGLPDRFDKVHVFAAAKSGTNRRRRATPHRL